MFTELYTGRLAIAFLTCHICEQLSLWVYKLSTVSADLEGKGSIYFSYLSVSLKSVTGKKIIKIYVVCEFEVQLENHKLTIWHSASALPKKII